MRSDGSTIVPTWLRGLIATAPLGLADTSRSRGGRAMSCCSSSAERRSSCALCSVRRIVRILDDFAPCVLALGYGVGGLVFRLVAVALADRVEREMPKLGLLIEELVFEKRHD